jgi:hypothetical protein
LLEYLLSPGQRVAHEAGWERQAVFRQQLDPNALTRSRECACQNLAICQYRSNYLRQIQPVLKEPIVADKRAIYAGNIKLERH